tara:strand:- start:336 stop:452 length:117 start_codon:yes stop_codon:yes gene_type:complete
MQQLSQKSIRLLMNGQKIFNFSCKKNPMNSDVTEKLTQ